MIPSANRTTYATLTIAALLATAVVVSPPASSANELTPGQEAASQIDELIANTGKLDGIPLTGQVTDTSASIVTSAAATVDVPKSDSSPLTISLPDGGNIAVKLPNSGTSQDAKQTESGLVYYAADAEPTNVVAPFSDGAQLINILNDENAAEAFTYDFGSGNVAAIQTTSDGGAVLVDSQGSALAIVDAPWAVDANGVSIGTRYEIDGLKLTQVISHQTIDTEYPIVADPRITYHFGFAVLHFNKSESRSFASGSSLTALGAGYLVPLVGLFIGVNAIWASNVVAKGNCIAIGYTPFGPVLTGTAWFIDERC